MKSDRTWIFEFVSSPAGEWARRNANTVALLHVLRQDVAAGMTADEALIYLLDRSALGFERFVTSLGRRLVSIGGAPTRPHDLEPRSPLQISMASPERRNAVFICSPAGEWIEKNQDLCDLLGIISEDVAAGMTAGKLYCQRHVATGRPPEDCKSEKDQNNHDEDDDGPESDNTVQDMASRVDVLTLLEQQSNAAFDDGNDRKVANRLGEKKFKALREAFIDKLATDGAWHSAKLDEMVKRLETYLARDKNNRAIVVGDSLKCLDAAAAACKVNGWKYKVFDGEMNAATRTATKNTFNTTTDIQVLILSTKVGSTGLNLSAGRLVLLLTPSWNPTMDGQAASRPLRINQSKDVEVLGLYAAGSIDQRIYQVQGNKELRRFWILERTETIRDWLEVFRSWTPAEFQRSVSTYCLVVMYTANSMTRLKLLDTRKVFLRPDLHCCRRAMSTEVASGLKWLAALEVKY